jgi:hypothetical protein
LSTGKMTYFLLFFFFPPASPKKALYDGIDKMRGMPHNEKNSSTDCTISDKPPLCLPFCFPPSLGIRRALGRTSCFVCSVFIFSFSIWMIRGFFMYWFRQLMAGRRGADLLTFVLLIFAIVLSRIAFYTRSVPVYVLFLVLFAWCVFRFFSRNLSRRAAENEMLLRLLRPLGRRISSARRRRQDRQYHRFFKCPHCKERLRVPKGKGKIVITCPKCGTEFTRTT